MGRAFEVAVESCDKQGLAAYAAMSRGELGLPCGSRHRREGEHTSGNYREELFGRARWGPSARIRRAMSIHVVERGLSIRWRQLWNELVLSMNLPVRGASGKSTVSEDE